MEALSTYLRPAAFHANAIVMVVCGVVGVDGFGVADGRRERLQSSGEISRMPLGAYTSRDGISTLVAYYERLPRSQIEWLDQILYCQGRVSRIDRHLYHFITFS
jgi:hypothetical protein